MGARTHGGQDPPHRACGSAEDSTASVIDAHPKPGSWCERERGSGWMLACMREGGEEISPGGPCKKNRSKRMNGDSGDHPITSPKNREDTVHTYHLYIYRNTVQVETGRVLYICTLGFPLV